MAALVFVGGILSVIYFRSITDWFIHKVQTLHLNTLHRCLKFHQFQELVLRPDSEIYDTWKKPPVGPVTKIYFFNWTNPKEFRLGAAPKFVEVGPYIYKEKWEKKNVTFHANATVSYETVKHYYFNQFKSKGLESDIIVTLNIPFVVSFVPKISFFWVNNRFFSMTKAAAIKLMEEGADDTQVRTLNFLANEWKLESSVSRTVKELLWGYKCNLTRMAKPLQNLTSEDFGLLVGV